MPRFTPLLLAAAIVSAAPALVSCANNQDTTMTSNSYNNLAKRIVGNWNIAAINAVPIADIPQQGVRDLPSFQIEPDGRVAGAAGVNRWFSSFDPRTLIDGSLTLSPIGSTLMAGPQQAMDLERSYTAALSKIRSVDPAALANNQLRFLDAEGNEILLFNRAN